MYNDPGTEKVCANFDKARERYLEKKEMGANGLGYIDKTAYEAMKKQSDEERRFHQLLRTIFYIVNVAGFSLEGRIRLVDRRTGRVWE